MAITFGQFMAAIAAQESGGNYSVVNAYGAVGKYQVLKSNIPNWSREILGYSVSWQKFRDSPNLQEKIVQGKLKQYFDAWGPRGAAAAWYAGPGNHNLDQSTRSQPGGPSIKGYVDSVISRAGGMPADSGGSYSAMGATAAAVPKLDANELMETYGLSSALINSSKELKSLFNQAVSGQWSGPRFQAALKNTKWWSTQSSSLRKYITTKFTDPATWKQQSEETAYKLNTLAVQVGLGNQIFQAGPGKGQANALLKQAVYNSLALGWTDARIKDWFGTKVSMHGGVMWGEAGEAFDKMHELAYLNGVKYSADWYKGKATAVASGKTTMETLEAEIRKAAAARYHTFADQIMAGQNAIDLAAPYIKTVSQLLELPETSVDMFDKHVYSAMNGTKAGVNFPLWEFENEVRNDPRWRKTNNARESMMTVARQVAKDFGMAY